jgi:hypothetical protein
LLPNTPALLSAGTLEKSGYTSIWAHGHLPCLVENLTGKLIVFDVCQNLPMLIQDGVFALVQDQAFLRETKIQKKGALGAEQLRELYSANLDLVGNNLYKNGMYIYINPSLIDADTPFLDYLGLHGYYFVTSVKSTVTPSGFDTQISALHEGIEFRGQKLLSATSGYGEDTLEERLPVDLPPEPEGPSALAGVQKTFDTGGLSAL